MRDRSFTTVRIVSGLFALAADLIAAGQAPAQPPAAGPEAFNNYCRTCHSIKEGDNRLGPSLYQVIGRKAGTLSGYGNYSQAMKSSGITWDETTLEKFVTNPEAVVPNNNMKPFKGVTDAAARQKIVAFLKAGS